MKYNDEKVTGDAGEHFFAYWIIYNFKYPCRLLDKDLGIDAKIEILNDDQTTTGEFILVQIKSSDVDEIKHSVKLRHLLYWESINLPVILVGINMLTGKVYWIHINEKNILKKYKERATNSKHKHTVININKDGIELKQTDKKLFETLRFKYKIFDFEEAIDCLKSAAESIISTYGSIQGDDENNEFTEIICRSNYYETVSNYILDLDWVNIYSKYINEMRIMYPTITEHLENYTKDDINNILKDVDTAYNTIEYTYDLMSNYIKSNNNNEYDKEVLIQLSKHKPIKSDDAQDLVNLVQGNY